MKTTIKITLTEEQREELTKGKKIIIEREREKELKKVNDDFDKRIKDLNNLFKTTKVKIGDFDLIDEFDDDDTTEQTTTKKDKLSDEELTKMFVNNLTIKQISEQSGRTEQTIRLQLKKLNLNLKDRK